MNVGSFAQDDVSARERAPGRLRVNIKIVRFAFLEAIKGPEQNVGIGGQMVGHRFAWAWSERAVQMLKVHSLEGALARSARGQDNGTVKNSNGSVRAVSQRAGPKMHWKRNGKLIAVAPFPIEDKPMPRVLLDLNDAAIDRRGDSAIGPLRTPDFQGKGGRTRGLDFEPGDWLLGELRFLVNRHRPAGV